MKNKKIFIACPISKYLTKEGIDEDFENFIKQIFIHCKKYTDNVFLALEREEYGKKKMYGSECTIADFEEMINTDILIAFPEDSMGVSVEIGWASAMKKKILIFIDTKYRQSELIKSIDSITSGSKIIINSSSGYKKQLNIILDSITEYLSTID